MLLSVHDGRKEEMVGVGKEQYLSSKVTRWHCEVNQLLCYEQ